MLALLVGWMTLVSFEAHAAITTDQPAGLNSRQINDLRGKEIPDDQWPLLLEAYGKEDHRATVQALIKELKPFPSQKLVGMLSNPKLAVRLGALDFLEEAAGDTFGFNAWQENPEDGGNIEALAKWKSWLESGAKPPAAAISTLNSETFNAIAMEIMSGNREQAERAMQRLDPFGLSAVPLIEKFLSEQINLEQGPRALLKAAEYRLVLMPLFPKQAAAISRDLALGRPEAQSGALAIIAKAGTPILPVVADFLVSTDPLVRESAVDAAFAAGKKYAVEMVAARLKKEKTESVLHAMLRGIGKNSKDVRHSELLTGFTDHPSENVIITALESLAVMQFGEVSAPLKKALKDPRWRVRASAMETIAKRRLAGLSSSVEELLADEDLFVRATAVETLQLILGNAQKMLLEQFAKQDDLKPVILRVLLKDNNNPPPAEVWEALKKASPEVILQCLEALEDRSDYEGKRIPYASHFATHTNRDVKAAALRLLAGRGLYPALLLEALKSSDQVVQDAVLDELKLPPGFFGAAGLTPAVVPTTPTAPRSPKSSSLLDRIYNAVTGTSSSPAATPGAAPVVPAVTQDTVTEMQTVLRGFFQNGSPGQRLRSAIVLASQGDQDATRYLLDQYETFSSLDRRAMAGSINNLREWPEVTSELAVRFLKDDADDVREKAIEVWMSGSAPAARLTGLLAELVRPGTALLPDDVYGYEMDRLVQKSASASIVLNWGREILRNPKSEVSHQVFAIVLMSRTGKADLADFEPFLKSEHALLRRAAYRALGLGVAEKNLEVLMKDDSAMVRMVLPFLASPQNHGWKHWFDDAHGVADHQDFETRNTGGTQFGSWAQNNAPTKAVSEETMAALEKLGKDPSEVLRFEALFSLLRLGKPVDPAALSALLPLQPEDGYASYRLGNYLEAHYSRLGSAYGALLPFATSVSEQNLPKMLAHFGSDNAKVFTSFAAMANIVPATVTTANQDNSVAPAVPKGAPSTAAFRVLFFHKPGCRDCDRVREMLAQKSGELPGMKVEEKNINEQWHAQVNEALSSRFNLKDIQHQVTPAVFTQAGVLVREEITYPRLSDLLNKTADMVEDPVWSVVDAAQIATATKGIEQRYDTLSLGIVATSGLLDGINPCAFATIIFLLSYLQVARRSPREILAVGAAFILAVFLTYFLVGLGLAHVLERLTALRYAGQILNYILAAFAVVVAVISFRDARLAAQGRLGDMTLQLPGSLKDQIRRVIRTGAKARKFVIAAFITGILISLLELACTGQVYLPTILYMLKSGRSGAVGHLLVYNIAFIIPLVVVFILAWGGMTSDALIRFQKERTSLVKVLTGILFVFLAAFLLFGHKILQWVGR